jgi:hypothetical protein
MRYTSIAAIAMVTAIAGCDAGGFTSPEPLSPDAISLAKAGAVVHRASGGGQILANDPWWQGYERYGFVAILREDGTTEGQLEFYWEPSDTRTHAEMVCLAVDGPDAGMVARITQGGDPFVTAGDLLGFTVRDNGQGADALPDMMGYFVLVDDPQACADLLDGVYLYELTDGNIRVE